MRRSSIKRSKAFANRTWVENRAGRRNPEQGNLAGAFYSLPFLAKAVSIS